MVPYLANRYAAEGSLALAPGSPRTNVVTFIGSLRGNQYVVTHVMLFADVLYVCQHAHRLRVEIIHGQLY